MQKIGSRYFSLILKSIPFGTSRQGWKGLTLINSQLDISYFSLSGKHSLEFASLLAPSGHLCASCFLPCGCSNSWSPGEDICGLSDPESLQGRALQKFVYRNIRYNPSKCKQIKADEWKSDRSWYSLDQAEDVGSMLASPRGTFGVWQWFNTLSTH